jgi:exodeoxyribonuclease VII large subunit
VQGQGAAQEIADAIHLINAWNARQLEDARLDLILVTRGGGSLEDLWAFNEEIVARAIFESQLPLVSAVGHEIDFTISDFVADLRAATPSAGAEIITEGVFSSCEFVAEAEARMRQLCRQQLEGRSDDARQLAQRLGRAHPRRRLDEWLQHLDDLQAGLLRCARQGSRDRQIGWRNLRDRLARVHPRQLLERRGEMLNQEQRRLYEQARHELQNFSNRLGTLDARLRLLGPEQVLARGYSITMDDATGRVIRAAAETKKGQRLRTRLKAGEVRSTVQGRQNSP